MSCLMSESNGSTYFQDSGFDTPMSASILRAVLMFPSGVLPGLSGSSANADTNPTTASVTAYSQYAPKFNAGETYGMMDLSANGGSTFAMYLKGYTGTGAKVISASMDPGSSNYFSKVLNTDASQIENKGHLLYVLLNVGIKWLNLFSRFRI